MRFPYTINGLFQGTGYVCSLGQPCVCESWLTTKDGTPATPQDVTGMSAGRLSSCARHNCGFIHIVIIISSI